MATWVRADGRLLTAIRRYGRFDVKGCQNCGGCTVVCDLSTGISFPRRPIQYGILGLRELVHGGLEPWLCHDCEDCSSRCPSGAEPGESMATLRRYLAGRYDWTGLGRWVTASSARYVGSLLTAGLISFLLFWFYHAYIVELTWSDMATTPMGLEHMFDIIGQYSLVVVLLPFLILAAGAGRMWWWSMRRGHAVSIPAAVYLRELKTLILHAVTQRNLGRCPESGRQKRRVAHWSLAAACVLKFVILVFFLEWFQTDSLYPIYHPQRWLGYLMAAGIVFGCLEVLAARFREKGTERGRRGAAGFTFPVLLLLTVLTGLGAHLCRYGGMELATHWFYAFHVFIATPLMVIELPFGQGAHMIYRPLALYFESVREAALSRPARQEAKAA